MTARAKITVNANHPAVWIEILNSRFSVAAKGYGRVDSDLPTGMYTVRYRAGDAVSETDVMLRPATVRKLNQAPDLSCASPAPLYWTWTSHEYHQEAAKLLSAQTATKRGVGAELMIFVRALTPEADGSCLRNLAVHQLDGKLVFDFENAVAGRVPHEAPWRGCKLALDPGSYLLRARNFDGRLIETVVVACPGWQTQVFLLDRFGNGDLGSALADACVFMSKGRARFNPRRGRQKLKASAAGEDLRLIDLARQALANGQSGLSTGDLNQMLRGKWRDPFLGIYGLHLLLMQPEPDLDLAATVVGNLRKLLCGFAHPDVEALAQIAGPPESRAEAVISPPMLRRSWQILVEKSIERSGLIQPGGLTDQIVDRQYAAGAWLIWRATDGESGTQESSLPQTATINLAVAAAARTIDSLLFQQQVSVVKQVVRSLQFDLYKWDEFAHQARLAKSELALLIECGSLELVLGKSALGKATPQPESPTLSEFVRRLGFPAAHVERGVRRLLDKLLLTHTEAVQESLHKLTTRPVELPGRQLKRSPHEVALLRLFAQAVSGDPDKVELFRSSVHDEKLRKIVEYVPHVMSNAAGGRLAWLEPSPLVASSLYGDGPFEFGLLSTALAEHNQSFVEIRGLTELSQRLIDLQQVRLVGGNRVLVEQSNHGGWLRIIACFRRGAVDAFSVQPLAIGPATPPGSRSPDPLTKTLELADRMAGLAAWAEVLKNFSVADEPLRTALLFKIAAGLLDGLNRGKMPLSRDDRFLPDAELIDFTGRVKSELANLMTGLLMLLSELSI